MSINSWGKINEKEKIYSSASAPLWWMDTNFRQQGAWDESSQPVEKCNFYLPHLHLAPPLWVMPSKFL